MDRKNEIVGRGEWGAFFGTHSDRERPPIAMGAFLSEKETPPMIVMPAEPFTRFAEAMVRIAEVVERQYPREEVKEEPATVPKEWYSVEETGKELNRSSYQIRDLCRRKVFGQKDSGGKWWIHRKEIENFRNGRTLIHGEVF